LEPEEAERIGIDCIDMWRGIIICAGDLVTVYPRGGRGIVGITGKVKAVTDSAIVLETDVNDIAIRYSEIKMIRKLKRK